MAADRKPKRKTGKSRTGGSARKSGAGSAAPRKLVVQVVDQHDQPLRGAVVQHFRNGAKGATVKLGTGPVEYEMADASGELRFVVRYAGDTQEKIARPGDVLLRFRFNVPEVVLEQAPAPKTDGAGVETTRTHNSRGSRDLNLNDLSGTQRMMLRKAFLKAFSPTTLDRLLEDNNKSPLYALVAPGDFETQLLDLIRTTQMEGWTGKLVEWAQARSDNERIKNIISELRLLDLEGDQHLVVGGSLERTVKAKAGIIDFVPWALKLVDLRTKVCRIEDPRDPLKALGTGFLVGPDLVLTCYHVVENYIDVNDPATGALRDESKLGCRFDYAVESAGENWGTVVPVANPGWLVAHSRFSAVDPGDEGGLPATTELDYALIRLAQPVGNAAVGTAPGKRGWIAASSLTPLPGPTDVVFIVQHPKGAALKLAVGTVIKQNPNGTRIRYDTNTEGGSSGAPCFDAKLDLVGLHHAGDPDTGQLAKYNQGVPIDKIIPDLDGKPGVPHFWV
ncbi:trypsin-like peptidase domain-containing protein [Bradyrhizobium sp.]